jgi:hypothetical protein
MSGHRNKNAQWFSRVIECHERLVMPETAEARATLLECMHVCELLRVRQIKHTYNIFTHYIHLDKPCSIAAYGKSVMLCLSLIPLIWEQFLVHTMVRARAHTHTGNIIVVLRMWEASDMPGVCSHCRRAVSRTASRKSECPNSTNQQLCRDPAVSYSFDVMCIMCISILYIHTGIQNG